MKIKHQEKPKEHRDIALERIKTLFGEADLIFSEDPSLSDKYVRLARKISLKYKVRMPSDLKRQICSKCFSFLKAPATCRVRLREGKAVYTCLSCGEQMRFPYTKKISK
jgi:ribonuclease P protein subunit RPR2